MSLFSLLTMLYQNSLTKCEKWSQDILVFEVLYLLPASCMYGKVNTVCRIFAKSISPKLHLSKAEIIQAYKILKTRDSKRFFVN